MKRAWLWGAALLGLLVAGAAPAQTVQAGGLELDFTGRLQVQFNTTSVGEDELGAGNAPPRTALETRRMRFGTNFTFDEWITGKVEADFGGSTAVLTDGYIDAAVTDGFSIRAGQFKQPFGLFELRSNTQILTIERTVRIRGVEDLVGVPGETHWLLDESGYLGRQIGVMAHGDAGGLGWAAGIFNGEGTNTREDEGSKAYVGRLSYQLNDPLMVAGAVSVQPTGVFDTNGDEITVTAFSVDAEWGEFRGDGLHVMAEVMFGENPLLITGADPSNMMGAQVATAWFMPRDGRIEGWEPVFRVSWADPDTDTNDDEGMLLTPGVNMYFSGRNRFMVNGEAYVPSATDVDTQFGLVAQFQVYF
jgi:hypothetical protein